MEAKSLFATIALLFIASATSAQNQEMADSLSRELQEVIVEARQPTTKLVGTTLVTTIPGSNLEHLGTALDVLAQLPMLKVQDNNVTVIGKSSIEIYIDGRPMRDEQELQQLLSSNLKKVELLMAPGAAYESTTGAVVKITTRRNFVKGLSLTDQLQIQKKRKLSAMDNLGLEYRSGGWEIFLNGTVNRNNSIIKGCTTNTLIYNGSRTVVGSTQRNSYPTTAGAVKGGFNYAKDSQSFGAYYRYNPEKGDFTNNGSEWIDNESPLTRDIKKRMRAHSHLVSLYYENRLADKWLLHFDGDFKSSSARSHTRTIYPDANNENVSSTDRRESTLWAGKLYVSFPMKGGEFTIGSQASRTLTSLEFQMLNEQVGEYIPSTVTDARQTSAALYASWAHSFGPLSLSAGARYEYIDYGFSVNGERDGDISRRDHLLTPDISLGYTFSEDSQITLSYKMATVRPPYSQLTGTLNYVGRHEIEGGNPALRDERMHDVQLFGMWKGLMLQADFTRSLDTYAFVKQPYPAPSLQLIMHPVNINVSALNLYLAWSKAVGRWTPNVTLGMYRQWLTISNNRYDKPLLSYYFDNTFALPGGLLLTANISGSTSGDMHTNRFGRSLFTMDASIGKRLLGNSLTVKLSATDIFNTANNDWTMNTFGVSVDKRQSYDRRGISLNLIYSFQPRKSKYKGKSAAEGEMMRL